MTFAVGDKVKVAKKTTAISASDWHGYKVVDTGEDLVVTRVYTNKIQVRRPNGKGSVNLKKTDLAPKPQNFVTTVDTEPEWFVQHQKRTAQAIASGIASVTSQSASPAVPNVLDPKVRSYFYGDSQYNQFLKHLGLPGVQTEYAVDASASDGTYVNGKVKAGSAEEAKRILLERYERGLASEKERQAFGTGTASTFIPADETAGTPVNQKSVNTDPAPILLPR